MKHIQVLGTGCASCKTTVEMIRKMADELAVEIQLEKVEDIADIAAAGVMSTPGVIVDGKIVHAGGMPSRSAVHGWLSAQ